MNDCEGLDCLSCLYRSFKQLIIMGPGLIWKVMLLVLWELMMDLKQAMPHAVSTRTRVCLFSMNFQIISFNSFHLILLVWWQHSWFHNKLFQIHLDQWLNQHETLNWRHGLLILCQNLSKKVWGKEQKHRQWVECALFMKNTLVCQENVKYMIRYFHLYPSLGFSRTVCLMWIRRICEK